MVIGLNTTSSSVGMISLILIKVIPFEIYDVDTKCSVFEIHCSYFSFYKYFSHVLMAFRITNNWGFFILVYGYFVKKIFNRPKYNHEFAIHSGLFRRSQIFGIGWVGSLQKFKLIG